MITQTYPYIEVICVNDGSTDSSGDLLLMYSEKYPNFTSIYQENKGLSAARNRGVQAATGDYIFFLDSDDFLSNESVLEELMNEAQTYDLDIVAGTYKNYYDTESKLNKDVYYDRKIINYILSGKSVFENGVRTNSLTSVVWNKLYKSNLIKDEYFLEQLYFEDMEYTIRILFKAERVKLINKVAINYRQRQNSITKSLYSLKKAKDYLIIGENILKNNIKNQYIFNWISICILKSLKISLKLNKKERMYILSTIKGNAILLNALIHSNKIKHKVVGFILKAVVSLLNIIRINSIKD